MHTPLRVSNCFCMLLNGKYSQGYNCKGSFCLFVLKNRSMFGQGIDCLMAELHARQDSVPLTFQVMDSQSGHNI